MEESYFHILNRGIQKNKIFFCDDDYRRFILGLYRFNEKKCSIRMPRNKNSFIGLPEQEEKLVEILKWTLMPNHYHLFVKEKTPGGAVEFAKRIGNGYTKYINIKNERSGYLFQNAAKIIRVEDNAHFLYLPVYIDLNILDLVEHNWKEDGVKNKTKAKDFLENYKWSSYPDSIGVHNFPEIMNTDLFYETVDMDASGYKKEVESWIDSVVKQNWSTCQVDQFE